VCSLAHKGRFFAALVAHDRGQRVGVDLEHVDATDAQLAQRILTDSERAVVDGLASEDRARGVTVHFSLKEAVYKALKPEVQDGLEHCEIEVTKWSPIAEPTW
jgi:phosphopantetheine--protein transferase-like protein